MSNMAVGIPIGLAVGLATGNATGRKQATDKIKQKINDYSAMHTISIIASSGVAVSVEQFADDICGTSEVQPAWQRMALMIGLAVFFVAGIVAYFLVTG